jgi:hypothetical protein
MCMYTSMHCHLALRQYVAVAVQQVYELVREGGEGASRYSHSKAYAHVRVC